MSDRAPRNDEHFLRRTFDTLYNLTPDNLRRGYQRIPRNIKLLIGSTFMAILISAFFMVLANRGVERITEDRLSDVQIRWTPPYDLETRATPVLDEEIYGTRTIRIPVIIRADYQETLRDFAEELYVVQQAEAEASEENTEETDDESEEPVPVSELPLSELPIDEIDEFDVLYELFPERDDLETYNMLLPELEGFERGFIEDVATHPTVDCLLYISDETLTGCDMEPVPIFTESADYWTVLTEEQIQDEEESSLARVIAIEYFNNDDVYDAVTDLFENSRTKGQVGNFVLVSSQPVKYYFAITSEWVIFVWTNENWMYVISAGSLQEVEQMTGLLPF